MMIGIYIGLINIYRRDRIQSHIVADEKLTTDLVLLHIYLFKFSALCARAEGSTDPTYAEKLSLG